MPVLSLDQLLKIVQLLVLVLQSFLDELWGILLLPELVGSDLDVVLRGEFVEAFEL
jgi:hypothetical protein